MTLNMNNTTCNNSIWMIFDFKVRVSSHLLNGYKIIWLAYMRTPKYICRGQGTKKFFTNSCTQRFLIRSLQKSFFIHRSNALWERSNFIFHYLPKELKRLIIKMELVIPYKDANHFRISCMTFNSNLSIVFIIGERSIP